MREFRDVPFEYASTPAQTDGSEPEFDIVRGGSTVPDESGDWVPVVASETRGLAHRDVSAVGPEPPDNTAPRPEVVSDVAKYHNPRFDPVRQEAHDFVTGHLGLEVAPLEGVALITPEQATSLREHHGQSWGGGYNPDNNTAVVIQNPYYTGPDTTRIYNGSATVHEISHTGTANANEHNFYNEALSGVTEYKYLDWQQRNGLYYPAGDFLLQRAGVELEVPRNLRYLDQRDAAGVPTSGPVQAHTSQGLLAALGVGYSMRASGLTSDGLLAMSRRNGSEQFAAMKSSLDTLKPGLAREVESLPETTDGAIQATAIIKDEARKKGLL